MKIFLLDDIKKFGHNLCIKGGCCAVMSIETYEQLTSRFELYGLLREGLDDVAAGKTRPFSEAMADIRSRLQL